MSKVNITIITLNNGLLRTIHFNKYTDNLGREDSDVAQFLWIKTKSIVKENSWFHGRNLKIKTPQYTNFWMLKMANYYMVMSLKFLKKYSRIEI